MLLEMVKTVSLEDQSEVFLDSNGLLALYSNFQASAQLVNSILAQDSWNVGAVSYLHETASLNEFVILKQPAILPPVELHAPRPVHSSLLLLEVPPDNPLNLASCLLDQVVVDPLVNDPLLDVRSLHSFDNVNRRHLDLEETVILLKLLSPSQKLLDQTSISLFLGQSLSVELLDGDGFLDQVSVASHLVSCQLAAKESLNQYNFLVFDFLNGSLFVDIHASMLLNDFYFLKHESIVGITYHFEIHLLSKEPPQELLHDYWFLLLLNVLPFQLCEKHSGEALDVHHDQFKFHVQNFFTGSEPPESCLYYFGSDMLLV